MYTHIAERMLQKIVIAEVDKPSRNVSNPLDHKVKFTCKMYNGRFDMT